MDGRGDDGFTQFVVDRQAVLLRFATALTSDSTRADEIVASVLVRAYERWDRIRRMAEPGAYVRRMVVNEYVSSKRRDRRLVPVADLDAISAPVSDGTAAHGDRDELIRALGTLPPKQRAAIVLRYLEGLADGEIAAALGCGLSGVRSNISRALAALRVTVTETPASLATSKSSKES